MKATELREEVKNYILNEVQTSLMRLSINAPLVLVVKKNYRGEEYLTIESAKFQTMPVIFKEVMITGTIGVEDDSEKGADMVYVSLEYKWESFSGGFNGTNLGSMVFLVDKDLPRLMTSRSCRLYIQKVQGLSI